jgi:hypothetical protein
MPTAFISYSWDDDEHKTWVRGLAARLRADGVDVTLDQWHVAPGDQLPQFMERAVRENDFVLIICTPRYKQRSDKRAGGVGYEGDIITGEVMTTRNQRKFIPILRSGGWQNAAPTWVLGKYYIDLSGPHYSEDSYEDLLTTLLGRRAQAPAVGQPRSQGGSSYGEDRQATLTKTEEFLPVKIIGIIVDQVGIPRADGSVGSALYSVPFRLSHRPSPGWTRLFPDVWNHPPRYTLMHRPGIAEVVGDTIVLDGTTVEEVERYHRDTLKQVVSEVNKRIKEYEDNRRRQRELKEGRLTEHKKKVEDAAKRVKFEE